MMKIHGYICTDNSQTWRENKSGLKRCTLKTQAIFSLYLTDTIYQYHVIDKIQPLCIFPRLQQNFSLFISQFWLQKMLFCPNLSFLLSTSVTQVAFDLSIPVALRIGCLIQRPEEHTDSKARKYFIHKQSEVQDRNTA